MFLFPTGEYIKSWNYRGNHHCCWNRRILECLRSHAQLRPETTRQYSFRTFHTYIHTYIHTYTYSHSHTYIQTHIQTTHKYIHTYLHSHTYIHYMVSDEGMQYVHSRRSAYIEEGGMVRSRRISSHFFPCRLRFIHLAAVAPWIDSGVRRWWPISWKLLHLIKSRCCWRFISKDLREDPSHHRTRQSELIWLFC